MVDRKSVENIDELFRVSREALARLSGHGLCNVTRAVGRGGSSTVVRELGSSYVPGGQTIHKLVPSTGRLARSTAVSSSG